MRNVLDLSVLSAQCSAYKISEMRALLLLRPKRHLESQFRRLFQSIFTVEPSNLFNLVRKTHF